MIRATRNAEIIDAVDAAVAEAASFDRAEINRLRTEADRKSPDGDEFMDYEQLMSIARMTTKAIDSEERLHHQWDGDGEYCERCGDKDWFAGPECKPAVKGHACRPEDREMVASPAGQELLSLAAEDLMRAHARRSVAATLDATKFAHTKGCSGPAIDTVCLGCCLGESEKHHAEIARLTAERDALQAKLVGPISEREKWLMAHALYAGDSYSELDEWLNDSADGIVTVEQYLIERMAEVFATTIPATEGETA